MPKFVRVYTGADGQSQIEELDFEMQEFVDSEAVSYTHLRAHET